jgi:exopolyphosphatase/guanosine-5'-triphosphate,3'-diphosphate pyrophosphatase
MTAVERSSLPGVSEGRSEQLVAGAIVAEAAMDILDIYELVICPWALREGVILNRMDTLPT